MPTKAGEPSYTTSRDIIRIEKGAQQLDSSLRASTELMQVMARACGHDHLSKFCVDDLTTRMKEMAELAGIVWRGAG